MIARVCTAWYRAPELVVGTVSEMSMDLDAPAMERCRAYGVALDVWSHEAAVCEMLAGRPIARAATGGGLLKCLLGTLGPCPRVDAGQALSEVPAYALEPRGEKLLQAAALEGPSRRKRLPQGPPWDVVRVCLQWRPERRKSLSSVSTMPWFGKDARCILVPLPCVSSPDKAHGAPPVACV